MQSFRFFPLLSVLVLGCIHLCAVEAPTETACEATIRVLATEFTVGPDGPSSPIILASLADPRRGWRPLFADLPVKPGQEDVADLNDGCGLILRATVSDDRTYQTDGANAFVFRDGDVLADFLKMNRVQVPYGSQSTLAATLGKRYDAATGRIKLTPAELLIAYELGTTDAKDPAYDFQDLVLLATFTDLTALAVVPRRTPEARGR